MTDPKPTSFVREHAPWSVSKAKCAEQCPHKFFLQYVEKPKVEELRTIESLVGNVIHKVLEYALGGGGKLSLERCFRLAIKEANLTTREIEVVRGHEPAVHNFLRKFKNYQQKHPCQTPRLEEELGVDFDGNPVDYWDKKGLIRGKIDVYMQFSNRPHGIILDHKTGKDNGFEPHAVQFDSYDLIKRANSPELKKIVRIINYVKTDRILMGPAMDVSDIQPLLGKVVAYLNETTDGAHQFNEVRPGPLCNWCKYKVVCRAHADGANGTKTK